MVQTVFLVIVTRSVNGLSFGRRVLVGVTALAVFVACAPIAVADAKESKTDKVRQHMAELEVGAQATLTTGHICESNGSDVVGCSSGGARTGFLFGARLRLLDQVSAGALGSILWSREVGTGTTTVQASAQLRYLPFGYDKPRFWLGPDAGVVYMVDHFEVNDVYGTKTTYSHVAPLVGAATGIGLAAGDYVEIQFGLRVYSELFGNLSGSLISQRVGRATQLGALVYVSLVLLPGDVD